MLHFKKEKALKIMHPSLPGYFQNPMESAMISSDSAEPPYHKLLRARFL